MTNKPTVRVAVQIGQSTTTLLFYRFNGKVWIWDEDYLSISEAELKYPKDQFEWVFIDD